MCICLFFRYQDILPPEKFRPLLKSLGGLNSTDYINALFLDSYFKKNHFIITQTPLHTTITDFWKLVYDYDVHTIIMAEDFRNEDNTCAEYWPGMNLKLFEPFFVETTATYQHESITIRNFSVRSTQFPKEPARLVRQFQFTSWAPQNITPPSRTEMLDLINGVSAWQEEACQDERPVIIHCQDGASHSGLFAVLAILCEKMEEEGEVDVYRTIKHCKRRRTKFFSDYVSYFYVCCLFFFRLMAELCTVIQRGFNLSFLILVLLQAPFFLLRTPADNNLNENKKFRSTCSY